MPFFNSSQLVSNWIQTRFVCDVDIQTVERNAVHTLPYIRTHNQPHSRHKMSNDIITVTAIHLSDIRAYVNEVFLKTNILTFFEFFTNIRRATEKSTGESEVFKGWAVHSQNSRALRFSQPWNESKSFSFLCNIQNPGYNNSLSQELVDLNL